MNLNEPFSIKAVCNIMVYGAAIALALVLLVIGVLKIFV
tara:strand:- start:371 stop:487 length:117 start_codon:yes stop_codon:yes gene_type:complete